MHFVTSCDANYLKYIKVLMASVYANHPNNEELTFHVLYRDLPEDEIKKVCAFAESHHQIAHFIEFDEEKYAPVMKKFFSLRWPVQNMYALFAHDMLPADVDRVLSLDIDTVVNGDLTELFAQDFDDCYLIATPETNRADNEPEEDFAEFKYYFDGIDRAKAAKGLYFNAGVLMFNLEKFRRDGVDVSYYLNAIGGDSAENIFFDQGILNLTFGDKTKYLTTCRYNYRISFSAIGYYDKDNNRYYDKRRYSYVPVENVKIIHYNGFVGTKPWDYCFETKDISSCENSFLWQIPECADYYKIWWKYARMTPEFEQLWTEQMMNKAAYNQIKKLVLDRNLDFVNQAGLETLWAPVWRNVNSIGKGDDLNRYIKPKVYHCVAADVKKTVKNLPEEFVQACGFRLTVKHISYSDSKVQENTALIQILEPNDAGAAVYRRYCGSPKKGKWGKWYRMATSADIEMLQEKNRSEMEKLDAFEKRIAALETAQISVRFEQKLAERDFALNMRELELKNEKGHVATLEKELATAKKQATLLEKELEKEKRIASSLEAESIAIKNSVSYRVGRAITAIPRKLRDLLKK